MNDKNSKIKQIGANGIVYQIFKKYKAMLFDSSQWKL